jgi:hypothetical protein
MPFFESGPNKNPDYFYHKKPAYRKSKPRPLVKISPGAERAFTNLGLDSLKKRYQKPFLDAIQLSIDNLEVAWDYVQENNHRFRINKSLFPQVEYWDLAQEYWETMLQWAEKNQKLEYDSNYRLQPKIDPYYLSFRKGSWGVKKFFHEYFHNVESVDRDTIDVIIRGVNKCKSMK